MLSKSARPLTFKGVSVLIRCVKFQREMELPLIKILQIYSNAKLHFLMQVNIGPRDKGLDLSKWKCFINISRTFVKVK